MMKTGKMMMRQRSAAATTPRSATASNKASSSRHTTATIARRGSLARGCGPAASGAASRGAHALARAASKDAPVSLPSMPMDLVFVSSEVAPWSKTGGLGDVVGGLPVELAKRGHRVMTVAPRYDQYSDAWDTSVVCDVLGEQVRFFHTKRKGVDRVFVDHPIFLAKVWGKTGSKLYGKKSGADYADNQIRFRIFCEAAIEAARCLPFSYGEKVTFVANDWHSALVPVLLKEKYQPMGEFVDAKAAFCVHNIAFQGRFWSEDWSELSLPETAKPLFDMTDGHPRVFSEDEPADLADETTLAESGASFAKLNWMKAGFLSSDKNITVSPNYACEVAMDAEKGVELDDVIAEAGGIEGIVNGMDTDDWNPLKDKFLSVKFGPSSVVEGKMAAKQELQAEAGLPVDPTAPIVGFIGRLEEQKGVDILLKAIPAIQKQCPDLQIVVLGTGKKKFEAMVKKLAGPNTVGVVKFSAPLAHLIIAGADFMAIPSRFEPCGLIQLQAMQYGTVPIVASTGGLVDTVKEGVTGFHMGALDPDNLTDEDAEAVASTIVRAAETYGTAAFGAMVAKCIGQDLSWAEPAKKWEAALEELTMPSQEATTKKEDVKTPVASI